MGIVDPLLYSDFVILDANLTLNLPSNITAYSGIDAMVHAIEASIACTIASIPE